MRAGMFLSVKGPLQRLSACAKALSGVIGFVCSSFYVREEITLALRICFCYNELVNFLTDSNGFFVTRL